MGLLAKKFCPRNMVEPTALCKIISVNDNNLFGFLSKYFIIFYPIFFLSRKLKQLLIYEVREEKRGIAIDKILLRKVTLHPSLNY